MVNPVRIPVSRRALRDAAHQVYLAGPRAAGIDGRAGQAPPSGPGGRASVVANATDVISRGRLRGAGRLGFRFVLALVFSKRSGAGKDLREAFPERAPSTLRRPLIGEIEMKNTSNHVHGISVNGLVPNNAILDGAEFLMNGRDPGAYRITIEHVSEEGKPLPVTVVWKAPDLVSFEKRKRPGKHELESLRSAANCLERACCVLEEIVDEEGDMRQRDTLYPNVAVAQKSVNFATRDKNHSPAFTATPLVAKGRRPGKILEVK